MMEENMKTIKSYFRDLYMQEDEVRSVTAIKTNDPRSPLIDGFDLLVLVITKNKQPANYISHYIKEDSRIQERWIHEEGLESWILNGENRSVIQWLLQGEILLDKDTFLEGLRHRLIEYPQSLREKKLFIEFSLFLRKYLQGKDYIQQKQILDAYSSVLEALHHWARITIIESGHHPEVMVWKQVKKINPGVYKLYEELTLSPETLEQRVELVLLACEFSVMSKMKECCKILFRVLESRKEPWSANELKYHPELKDLHVELALVLQKLQKKALVTEVAVVIEEDLSVLEMKYRSS
jgi:hypothetical protein